MIYDMNDKEILDVDGPPNQFFIQFFIYFSPYLLLYNIINV